MMTHPLIASVLVRQRTAELVQLGERARREQAVRRGKPRRTGRR